MVGLAATRARPESGLARSSAAIRIMVVDDHPIVRAGLAAMLGYESTMEVVAEAAGGREAVELYRLHRPDVTLMDLRMPAMGGVATIRAIRQDYPAARIILLTTFDTDEEVFQGLRAGARAYLLKDARCEQILDAIRAVHSGARCITAEVGAKLAERAQYSELSDREVEVLALIVQGKSNREIADALYLAEGTVKFHVGHLLAKLDVGDRTQAVIAALKRGLASLD